MSNYNILILPEDQMLLKCEYVNQIGAFQMALVVENYLPVRN